MDFVHKRIRREEKKGDDPFVNAIFLVLYKLKGHSLQDVMNMYITQFYVLVEMLVELQKEEERAMKKSKRK